MYGDEPRNRYSLQICFEQEDNWIYILECLSFFPFYVVMCGIMSVCSRN